MRRLPRAYGALGAGCKPAVEPPTPTHTPDRRLQPPAPHTWAPYLRPHPDPASECPPQPHSLPAAQPSPSSVVADGGALTGINFGAASFTENGILLSGQREEALRPRAHTDPRPGKEPATAASPPAHGHPERPSLPRVTVAFSGSHVNRNPSGRCRVNRPHRGTWSPRTPSAGSRQRRLLATVSPGRPAVASSGDTTAGSPVGTWPAVEDS